MGNSSIFVVAIFMLTYVGVAFGGIPGLGIDRTGIALLGAIAMVVSGAVPIDKAVAAVDLPTIILLYALSCKTCSSSPACPP
jgi:Na+/H+ antiporter NhaD/arsenite permease-like protein